MYDINEKTRQYIYVVVLLFPPICAGRGRVHVDSFSLVM